MASKLSTERWMEQEPPIFWAKIKDHSNIPAIQIQMMEKWCSEMLGTWWYRDGAYWCFGNDTDRTLFIFWYKTKPFEEDYNTIGVK